MEIFGPQIELFRSSQKGFNCKTWVEISTGSKNGGRFAPVLGRIPTSYDGQIGIQYLGLIGFLFLVSFSHLEVSLAISPF